MAQSQTPAAPSDSQARNLNLPPPQTFDILPAVQELLARIDHVNSPNSSGTALLESSEHGHVDDPEASYMDLAPLDPKDLSGESLQIKTKIRHALKALERLPDMDRSVDEQQAEIEQLRTRIAWQQAMVEKLGRVAEGAKAKMV